MSIKVIKTEDEYQAALDRIQVLMDTACDSQEEDELEVLAVLVEDYESDRYPIGLPDPVSAIKFRMEQLGLSNKAMRQYLGSASRVSEVLSGTRSLSLHMIRQLHQALDIPFAVLLAEPQSLELKDCQYNFNDYPFTEMYKCGYFSSFKGSLIDAKVYAEELLQDFFSVFASQIPMPVYCKKTDKAQDHNALMAWQARVIHLTKTDNIMPFSRDSFTSDFIRAVVKLSYSDEGPKIVKEYLNKKGIHFITLAHLSHTNLDGASFLTPQGQPVVALTLRFDRSDNFWFTLAHELGHVYLHLVNKLNSASVFFDEIGLGEPCDTNQPEIEANNFAREIMIPASIWETQKTNLVSAQSVTKLADQIGISAAIVAGRLRWETGNYKKFRNLIGYNAVRSLFGAPSC